MTKTYAQLQKQITALTREAEALKRKEAAEVVARIKQAIEAYGLTASDLGLSAKRGPKPKLDQDSTKKATTKTKKKRSQIKYRDGTDNTWVGRGPRPQWLRDALAQGKALEDFAV
ncbi:H-NS histone family protein [Uliginosibacterium sp. H3]|uniref:H-NS histone family protein n=1 Tax=Uliginosibacterium silvisoli TaxID=3114758 RepID=A0ABU6K6N5_9RHOO|nr:H-NS histone family protein [Uliginosibacterium sp. H3]